MTFDHYTYQLRVTGAARGAWITGYPEPTYHNAGVILPLAGPSHTPNGEFTAKYSSGSAITACVSFSVDAFHFSRGGEDPTALAVGETRVNPGVLQQNK